MARYTLRLLDNMWPSSHTNSLAVLLLSSPGLAQVGSLQDAITDSTRSINNIPFSTRAYWIRRVNAALAELPADASPCPLSAFATAIVNHTVTGLGELVCLGVNSVRVIGNPTLHGELVWRLCCWSWKSAECLLGEIVAIQNCTTIMTDPSGLFNFTPSEAKAAFSQLSLYTNAESCPMVSYLYTFHRILEVCTQLLTIVVCFGNSLDRLSRIHLREQHAVPPRTGVGPNPGTLYRHLPTIL